ncbi:MAG TPA: cytochrome c-type biogenesis protein [Gaiellaceae bacterium]|nr:cytochrome c-type biogenesis protein [Gaiellaceae bacterium]
MRRALLLCLLGLLAFGGVAGASEQQPTLAELEREVICPTCKTTLELSDAPVADRMRAFIRRRIAAGDTKSEIKDALVAQFGEAVLAAPPREGFNLLAWLLPLAGATVALAALGVALRRWSRTRAAPAAVEQSANGRPSLDPELERRLDEELARFDA